MGGGGGGGLKGKSVCLGLQLNCLSESPQIKSKFEINCNEEAV